MQQKAHRAHIERLLAFSQQPGEAHGTIERSLAALPGRLWPRSQSAHASLHRGGGPPAGAQGSDRGFP
ncbi:hypothetical protein ACTMU2_15995 [Cupriavidus basilensis]